MWLFAWYQFSTSLPSQVNCNSQQKFNTPVLKSWFIYVLLPLICVFGYNKVIPIFVPSNVLSKWITNFLRISFPSWIWFLFLSKINKDSSLSLRTTQKGATNKTFFFTFFKINLFKIYGFYLEHSSHFFISWTVFDWMMLYEEKQIIWIHSFELYFNGL